MFLVIVVPSRFYHCNQRGVFWVQMCLVVRSQWTTPLSSRTLRFQASFKPHKMPLKYTWNLIMFV